MLEIVTVYTPQYQAHRHTGILNDNPASIQETGCIHMLGLSPDDNEIHHSSFRLAIGHQQGRTDFHRE